MSLFKSQPHHWNSPPISASHFFSRQTCTHVRCVLTGRPVAKAQPPDRFTHYRPLSRCIYLEINTWPGGCLSFPSESMYVGMMYTPRTVDSQPGDIKLVSQNTLWVQAECVCDTIILFPCFPPPMSMWGLEQNARMWTQTQTHTGLNWRHR